MALSDAQNVPAENARQTSKQRLSAGIVATGGVLGAVAASSCCLLPLALFTLGAGGAWIGNLTALAPYQPLFITLSLGFIGAGFYLVYRRPEAACPEDSTCARPASRRGVKTSLWGATLLVIAAMAFPYYAPLLIGIY